jgi:hypothetical protein
MIKAHNVRHALLGAIVFIAMGSFGACSTDPLAPSTDAATPPTPNVSTSMRSDSTFDGTTTVSTLGERCVLINGLWYCTGQG